MGFFQEFKDFAMRGNVVDLAVGLIIGAEFGKIINSAVNDLIMPPIGKAMGGVNFTDLKYPLGETTASIKLGEAKQAMAEAAGQGQEAIDSAQTLFDKATADVATYGTEVAINYGNFVQNVLNFLIIAMAVFMVVRLMNSLKAEEEEEEEVEETPANEVLLGEIRDLLKK